MNQQRLFMLLFFFTGFLFGFKAKGIMGWPNFIMLGSLFILGALFAVAAQGGSEK